MPDCVVTIQPHQYRALRRKLKKTGTGSISREIRKALDLYLAGPRGIEIAFEKLLLEKRPKEVPAMLALFDRKVKAISRTMKQLEHEMRNRKKEIASERTK